MTASSRSPLTFADYIAFEEKSELRYEYEAGQIFAMAGGPPEHAALVGAVFVAVSRQLAAGCRSFVENLRVRTPSGKAAYPDILVVCGPLARDAEDENTVTNPRLIVEVLSESAEAYDRGKKFAHYRSCPSFIEYVLVASHGEPLLERFVKQGDVWMIAETASPGETLHLSSVPAALDVHEIYRDVLQSDGTLRVV